MVRLVVMVSGRWRGRGCPLDYSSPPTITCISFYAVVPATNTIDGPWEHSDDDGDDVWYFMVCVDDDIDNESERI